ncbi:MAG: DMT family transporter [Bacteroidales bacterium]|nr:DMT family transporter [Bacteroidales bacterium]
MTTNNRAITFGAIAVLSWSTVASAFKIAGQYMTPFQMVLVSTITSFVILCVVLTLQRHWGAVKALTAKNWGLLALLGLLNPVAYYLVLFKAYAMLPAQVAQPINYLWPIVLLVLLAVFGGQPIPARKYIGMAISLAGVAFISMGGSAIEGRLSGAGMGVAFLSALLWASYWIVNKKYCSGMDATVSFFGTFLFGSIYMALAATVVGWPQLSTPALLSGAYIGAFEMAVPFVFFGIALRISTNPAIINQMCYLSPFLSLFFISAIVGEPIVATTYIGLALIVAGIVYNQYFAMARAKA